MPTKTHTYGLALEWVGNLGSGTSSYRSYSRDHLVSRDAKVLAGSSDAAYRGDANRWNPEELLVASLSQCHMLWYLDMATRVSVIVTRYRDDAVGLMAELPDGAGQFTLVTLQPHVTVLDESMRERADRLHDEAHEKCFIARSVNFPVEHRPTTEVEGAAATNLRP
jgi:organic hydroperoxide reductase OsmC/OhrA